ncbi:MAG: XdhC family protein [Flavobacteriaceae bacterium]|nr:XdhC family protein [Flavobacteriaceae bacterium]
MKFWQQLLSKLEENKSVYVLTVIANSGSSPGRKGFKMLVAEDGFIFGSVGGGVMEFSLVEEVKILLKEKVKAIFLRKQIHQGNVKDSSGMICSGEQTVVFHPLNSDAISDVKNLIECLENNNNGIIKFTPNLFEFFFQKENEQPQIRINSSKDWIYEERIGNKDTLYIVGGGHVGLATSKLFNSLGFYVIVFDDRKNINTFESNGYAHKKQLISYVEIENHIKQGDNIYIAIMTNKYTDDKLVLSKTIKNNYKFIGVLGSTSKIKTMNEVLLKEGFFQDDIDRVHAPIGLSIYSQTPDEIAVSIAAQIIQLKNKFK